MENNDKKEILDAISDFAQDTQDQFDEVNKKFDVVNNRFDAVNNQFDAINRQFDDARKERQGIRHSFNELQTSVDNYAKRAETVFEELVSVNNAIKRHEKWF